MPIDNIEIKISCDECGKEGITESIIFCQECGIKNNPQINKEKIAILLAALEEIQDSHLSVGHSVGHCEITNTIIARAKKAVEIPGEAKKLLVLSHEYLQTLDNAHEEIEILKKVNNILRAQFKQLRLRLEKARGDGYTKIFINELMDIVKQEKETEEASS